MTTRKEDSREKPGRKKRIPRYKVTVEIGGRTILELDTKYLEENPGAPFIIGFMALLTLSLIHI